MKTVTTTVITTLSKTLIGLSLVLSASAQAAEPFDILEAALKRKAELSQVQLIKVVESNPKLSKEVKLLSVELKAIQQSGKESQVRFKMAQSQLAKRKLLLDQVYSTALFDENQYHAEQMKLVSAYNQKSKQKIQIINEQ